ncbi:MAG: hypothetical protein ACUVTO_07765 [Candidatus Caldatribacteriaceae bacterium]
MTKGFDARALEKAIGCLEGVLNAKVVGETGIEEIHVLTRPTKSPKLLVRDIETLLKARFDLDVDHKKISVVTFDVGEGTKWAVPRLVLWGIGWKKTPDAVQVEVEMKLGDRIYRGVAAESAPRVRSHGFLVARATLNCLNQVVGDTLFMLHNVSTHHLGEIEVVLAFVDYARSGVEKDGGLLVGTALVQEDIYEAVARATLDAVNRKLVFHVERLEEEQGGPTVTQ